jgi:hypothetical protein
LPDEGTGSTLWVEADERTPRLWIHGVGCDRWSSHHIGAPVRRLVAKALERAHRVDDNRCNRFRPSQFLGDNTECVGFAVAALADDEHRVRPVEIQIQRCAFAAVECAVGTEFTDRFLASLFATTTDDETHGRDCLVLG